AFGWSERRGRGRTDSPRGERQSLGPFRARARNLAVRAQRAESSFCREGVGELEAPQVVGADEVGGLRQLAALELHQLYGVEAPRSLARRRVPRQGRK